MDPSIIAAGIGAGASILGSAFGQGDSSAKQARLLRKQYKYAERYSPRVLDATEAVNEKYRNRVIQGKVADAKAAGLHPLYAMGAPGPGSGGSPSFSMPGQSDSGSAQKNGLMAAAHGANNIAQILATKELVEQQNKASIIARTSAAAGSNNMIGRHPSKMDPKTQEYKKGEFMAYDGRHPEQSRNVKSPWTKLRMGSQSIWVPTDEIDTFMEDPAMVGGATFLYHGNKNIDWPLLYNDFRKGGFTSAQVTKGTKNMFGRLARGRKVDNMHRKARKRSTFGNQFYSYSRGPHR